MKIAIDIDDTLAEYTDALLRYHEKLTGRLLNPKDHNCYEPNGFWGNSLEEKLSILNAFDFTEEFDHIVPSTGAQNTIDELAKSNELFIITSRPSGIKTKTQGWLETYFPGKFSGIHMDSSLKRDGPRIDKSVVCRKLKIDCLIEDSHEQARLCHGEITKVILLNRPWNQNKEVPTGVYRVDNWESILLQITELKSQTPSSSLLPIRP